MKVRIFFLCAMSLFGLAPASGPDECKEAERLAAAQRVAGNDIKRCSSAPPRVHMSPNCRVRFDGSLSPSASQSSAQELELSQSKSGQLEVSSISDSESEDVIVPKKKVDQEWLANRGAFFKRLAAVRTKYIERLPAHVKFVEKFEPPKFYYFTSPTDGVLRDMQMVMTAKYVEQFPRFFPHMYRTYGKERVLQQAEDFCKERSEATMLMIQADLQRRAREHLEEARRVWESEHPLEVAYDSKFRAHRDSRKKTTKCVIL